MVAVEALGDHTSKTSVRPAQEREDLKSIQRPKSRKHEGSFFLALFSLLWGWCLEASWLYGPSKSRRKSYCFWMKWADKFGSLCSAVFLRRQGRRAAVAETHIACGDQANAPLRLFSPRTPGRILLLERCHCATKWHATSSAGDKCPDSDGSPAGGGHLASPRQGDRERRDKAGEARASQRAMARRVIARTHAWGP